jgi:hypothetical protein
MSRTTLIVLSLTAAVTWAVIFAIDPPGRPVYRGAPLPADGSVPPLPPPIEVR